jgi:hypothetical protein
MFILESKSRRVGGVTPAIAEATTPCRRCRVAVLLPLALWASLHAQTPGAPEGKSTSGSPTTTTAKKEAAPAFLQLPRLKSVAGQAEPRLLPAKYTTDRLSPQGITGALTVDQSNLKYLTLDAGANWSRPLRGSPRDVTFVSFLAYGSVGTTFDIGGAILAVKPSAKAGSVQLVVNDAVDYSIKIETHKGAARGALPIVTVRIDPVAGVWDLYVFDRLLAYDLPLANVNGARKFNVQAGKEGAALCGLVLADENPLFIDANANGVDDAFEKTKRNGTLLASTAPAAERKQLVLDYVQSQRGQPAKGWSVRRPLPDGVAVKSP